jgi:hypothetical protein
MMISAQTATALRIVGMAGSPLAIAELFKATLAQKAEGAPTVFDSVYTHCVLIMVTLCYYCIAKFFILSCLNPPHRGAAHRKDRDRGEPYVGVHAPNVATSRFQQQREETQDSARGDQRAAGAQGLPRLTIRNVWILVYGLGLVFFVTGYCMLGLHAVCLTSIALAMGVLAIEELVCPRVHLAAIYVSLRVACLLTGLVGLVLVSCDVLNEPVLQYARTLDFYSILFGLCLPFAAQFLMATVRDFRHYALGSILEVCEFGFPFAAFLGIFHIGVAYGQRFEITSEANNPPPFEYGTMFNESLDYYYWYHKNLSAQGMLRTDGPVILFFGLTPLLIVPSLVCYVSCVLRGSSIDPLLSLSLALCIQQVLPGGDKGGPSTLGIYGGVCCAVACMLRVFCEFQANLPLAPLNLQCESTHLTERVVRDTHARRSKEMQAEGSEHEKEEEEEGDGTQSAPLIISRL